MAWNDENLSDEYENAANTEDDQIAAILAINETLKSLVVEIQNLQVRLFDNGEKIHVYAEVETLAF